MSTDQRDDHTPPNAVALANADLVRARLAELGVDPTDVKEMDSADGGVAFVVERPGRYADIECLNDGAVLAGKLRWDHDARDCPPYEPIDFVNPTDMTTFRPTWERIVAFMGMTSAPKPCARYRLVFYTEPFTGHRVPIAALVHSHRPAADGRPLTMTAALSATRLPCATCIGEGALALIRAVLRDLDAQPVDFDRLPRSVGPQVELGPAIEVPTEPSGAIEWVRSAVLDRIPGHPRE